MKKSAAYITQWVKWSGGLLVAGLMLLLLLPAPSIQVSADITPSTCLSSTASHNGIQEVAIYGRNVMVLATPSIGFSFLPSLVLAPGLVASFLQTLCLMLSARLRGSISSFTVLRLLFEHQIAINAP